MEKGTSVEAVLAQLPGKIAHFRIAQRTRASREKPRALVVEDQLFSRRLLETLLREACIVETAATAQEGLGLYLDNAPDIAFLDIELMDESGHSLARAIRTLDPSAFIVMVTGNNSVEDVAMAQSNRVDGFIVKPYSRQKINESMDKFFARGKPT